MIEFLLKLDRDLFLELNSYHAEWLDAIMMYVSEKLVWIPLYLAIAYFIFKYYGKRGILVLVCIALAILLADQITSTFMKPFFARLRPTHDPELQNMVHIVNGYRAGSKFGFASSHAANTFGLAMFVVLLFGKRSKHVTWIFLWAAVVAYSRIYLGVHYPGDVIVGGAIGMICAFGCYHLFKWISVVIDKPAV
jgi:undecaprenyl-diphosphatase